MPLVSTQHRDALDHSSSPLNDQWTKATIRLQKIFGPCLCAPRSSEWISLWSPAHSSGGPCNSAACPQCCFCWYARIVPQPACASSVTRCMKNAVILDLKKSPCRGSISRSTPVVLPMKDARRASDRGLQANQAPPAMSKLPPSARPLSHVCTKGRSSQLHEVRSKLHRRPSHLRNVACPFTKLLNSQSVRPSAILVIVYVERLRVIEGCPVPQ